MNKYKRKKIVTSALPPVGSLRNYGRTTVPITSLIAQKDQINLIFQSKDLCIPFFCSNFVADLCYL